jgi:hypothetical protein
MKILYLFLLLISSQILFAQIPKYASRPSATSVVYLDFDGHRVENTSWNTDESSIDAAPAELSAEDIFKIYRIVKEDFITFNVNITTDSMYYEQASVYSRHRVIITPTSYWRAEGTGVAVIGCFAFGDETPSFVFSDRLGNHFYKIGQIVAHEIGHALGLQHISEWNEDCTLKNEYKGQTGTVFPTFSPIMGESFDSDITGWVSDFSVLACDDVQDEISMFHSGRFGFIPVADDISNYFAGAKTFSEFEAHVTDGIINDSNDIDIFKLSLKHARIVDIDITPNRINKQTRLGINLNLAVDLYDADSVLIRTYHDTDNIDIFIDTILNAGTYYFAVRAVGNENMPRYSSFGSYEFLYLVNNVTLNDMNIDINGLQKGYQHELRWSFSGGTMNGTALLQHSVDGVNFSPIYKDSLRLAEFIWMPQNTGSHYYRVGIMERDGSMGGYSKVLKMGVDKKTYRLSYTMISDKIELLMYEPGEYELIDLNGRVLQRGKLGEGYQKISLMYKPKGVVLLRILQKGARNVEKLMVL